MKELLDNKNSALFSKDFPIFYKNRIQKTNNRDRYFYRSAVDGALRNNQVRAVGYIIDHIVKHQNHHVSSFLFQKNFPDLLDKGLDVAGLLRSNIFCFTFDYDEWPSTHTDHQPYSRPYNGSVFDLRHSYRTVFHEDKFQSKGEADEEAIDSSKVYKVSYKINMLPMLGEYVQGSGPDKEMINEGQSIMDMCIQSQQQKPS